MNKGGVLKDLSPGGSTGISGQTVTPKLDNTASEQYFNTTNGS